MRIAIATLVFIIQGPIHAMQPSMQTSLGTQRRHKQEKIIKTPLQLPKPSNASVADITAQVSAAKQAIQEMYRTPGKNPIALPVQPEG